jgi:amino acid adenylation domain-containing protein
VADFVGPASYGQERLWLAAMSVPGTPVYNVATNVVLPYALTADQVTSALRQLVDRHEPLRTSLRWDDATGSLTQVVHARIECRPEVVDLGDLEPRQQSAVLDDRMEAMGRIPFDLAAAPLWRAEIVRKGPASWIVLLVLHHTIFDAGSQEVLRSELRALCAAFAEGGDVALPELPIQYVDFAAWQRGEVARGAMAQAADYWRVRLAGIPAAHALPTDRPRPRELGYAGADVRFALADGIVGGVTALARDLGATPFMVYLAAYAAFVGRLSGQRDVVIGVPSSDRDRPELSGLIGMLINNAVVRVDLAGRPAFAALVERVRDATVDALEYRSLPFQLLVEAVAPRREPGLPPVYQLAFNYIPMVGTDKSHGTARADMLLELSHTHGRLEYSTDLFDAGTAASFAERYLCLLAAMLADPAAAVDEASLLSDAEQERILADWSRGPVGAAPGLEATVGATLHGLVEAQASRTPDALAVSAPGGTLTYTELDERAAALARRLAGLGVTVDDPVAVCVPRSVDLPVALLAILKAGGAYVPLDPEYPQARLDYMLEDCGAKVALVQAGLEEMAAAVPYTIVLGAEGPAADDDMPAPDVALPQVPDSAAAYVIYTSGSTGRPKGVPNPHRAVVNHMAWMQEQYALGADDVVLQKTPTSFDVSVWELFWPLMTGARLLFAAPGGHLDPVYLRGLIEAERVTTVHFVPSMLGVFLEEALGAADGTRDTAPCPSLRRVICIGEVLPADLARRCLARLPGAQLWNLYGPTEAAIDVSAWQCLPDDVADAVRVPIGRPFRNLALYVLDNALRPMPPGVTADLYIGGVGLARGYHRRPGLTAQRFVPDPFGPPGSRMYRTGDLAAWRPDGVLDFFGRDDQQVKLRGQRIELGEIETAMRAFPGVRDAAAAVHDPGPYLVGYVAGDADLDQLRAALAEQLPKHMVPGVLVPLPALPLSANGKLDRSALRPPTAPPAAASGGTPARLLTPTEELVASIWAEAFDRPAVPLDADFFDLGGHSLLATKISVRLTAATGADVPIRVVLTYPTPARLAAHVDELLSGGADIRHEPIPARAAELTDMPLTHAQQSLWFLQQMDPTDPQLSVPIARRLRGELDEAALAAAFDGVVARHAALRTVFVSREGRPVQIVQPAATPAWRRHDVTDLPVAEREARAAELVAAAVGEAFHLDRAPLLRCTLVRLADEDHVLLLLMHHLVTDGWSMKLLLDEIAGSYTAIRTGAPFRPKPLPVQYADVALAQRVADETPGADDGVRFWLDRLRGAPPLALPTDRPRPGVRSTRGGTIDRVLDAGTTGRLDQLARAQRCTSAMVLLAAYQAVLGAWSGQDDFCVGSPVAGRHRIETEPLIGLFTNTVVLRADLSGDPTFADLLARVRRDSLDAYLHDHVPFERLITKLGIVRDAGSTPVFQALFTVHTQGTGDVPFAGLAMSGFTEGPQPARVDISLTSWRQRTCDGDEVIALRAVYCDDLFEAASAEAFLDRLARLLAAVAKDPSQRLGDFDFVSRTERDRLLAWATMPTTASDRATSATVSEMVAARITADPGGIAVRHGVTTLTYAELGERVDRLAAALRGQGAGPDAAVAVCVDPGIDLVVSFLAVWRAGGAYLPLNPGYPARRIRYLLEDARSTVVATTKQYTDMPGLTGVRRVLVDDLPADPGFVPRLQPPSPGTLAYVIHTSGSTGEAKGVAVTHAGLAARVAWMRGAYQLGRRDKVLQFAAVTFDTHAEEIYPCLAAGATLVISPNPALALPELLASDAGRDLTVIDLPTPYWHELVARGTAIAWPGSLRLAIIGAAEARADAVRDWHELTGGRVRLVNTYGPTEAVIVATAAELGADASGRPPIGRPVAQTTAMVCDARGRLAPAGVPGELYLSGTALARGYLGRPGLTASLFVPDPYGPPGARRYRTGDRARWRPDGQLEFLGRLDSQVKVRGYRIEPGEVEAYLTEHAAVSQAAVVARDERLTAYLVPVPGETIDVDAVRAHVSAAAPAYLVPSLLTVLDRLPLTAHGKLDQAGLPAPAPGPALDTERVAPRTEAEELVTETWSEVLGIEEIGVLDDFFDLGGHSLIATRVVARLSAVLALEVPVATIFLHPTPAALAAELERLVVADVDALTDAEVERELAGHEGQA